MRKLELTSRDRLVRQNHMGEAARSMAAAVVPKT